MPTVWIANRNPARDYAQAAGYGPLRELSGGSVNVFALERVLADLHAALGEARPDDYLLLSGTNVINAFAVALWLRRFGRIRLLLHDYKAKRYWLRELKASAFDPAHEEDPPCPAT